MASQTQLQDKIPVRNLWLLLLYASELLKTLDKSKRDKVEDNPDELPDLVARLLTGQIEVRLRHGLSPELDRRHADLSRVRGRIDHIRTARKHLLQRGMIACIFDEFTTDTPRNRLVKAGLNKIAPFVNDDELRRKCSADAYALEKAGVSTDHSITRSAEAIYRTADRASVEDQTMLSAALLAFGLKLPTEESGGRRLPVLDKLDMPKLFEKAVYGFYKIKLSDKWNVGYHKESKWSYTKHTEQISQLLPKMQMDTILERKDLTHTDSSENRIIIDTKFSEILNDREKFNSNNMYQLYAYLRSQERDNDLISQNSTGILLHPAYGQDFDEWAIIQGHKIRFVTVDLMADSGSIRKRLCDIIPD